MPAGENSSKITASRAARVECAISGGLVKLSLTDTWLRKPVLYQLSYVREAWIRSPVQPFGRSGCVTSVPTNASGSKPGSLSCPFRRTADAPPALTVRVVGRRIAALVASKGEECDAHAHRACCGHGDLGAGS